MSTVNFEKHGDVAVLWMNHSPVNALGVDLRTGIADALQSLLADPEVESIVLASSLTAFSAGADIKEFSSRPIQPTLRDLIGMLEAARKPIVAAIDGVALGGGLELALGCDARIVTPAAKLGLPETSLGLLPGAGGTQRLPRLIGAAPALTLMANAKPLTGDQSVDVGLADQVVAKDDLLNRAIDTARQLAKEGRRRCRDRVIAPDDAGAFETQAAAIAQSRKGEPQIEALIESVRATFSADFDAGLKIERDNFERLLVDVRSKALRHMFFAERQASTTPRAQEPTHPVVLEKVGIVGGGTMGAGIAMAFAAGGIPVVIKETTMEAAAKAVDRIRANYDRQVTKGSIDDAVRQAILARITPTADYDAFDDVDLVVEAAFEDMDVKREIFSALERAVKPAAILATNTSYLDIDRLAETIGDRSRVLGMHFFSPANVMNLVEVVNGAGTSPAVLASIVAVSRQIGKLPVVVGNCHGFVGNRMLAKRSEQLDRLLLEGATPEEIDTAMVEFGFKMGPCAISDLAGLDISWRMRRATGRAAPAADALVEKGRLGQKSRAGYFVYGVDGRKPYPDPEASRIIQEVAGSLGITPRKIERTEILDRLLLPMINEAARILDEGIAGRESDIDVIWVHGYGFPRHRGGPMFYAKSRGYDEIVARLENLAVTTGDQSLSPAPYLKTLAQNSSA